RWLLFITVLVLGLISTLSIGAVLGALMSNPKFMGLVMMGLIAISGIFYPIVALPLWLQGLAQAFPLYWLGLGLRASLLPDSMAAVEIGGSGGSNGFSSSSDCGRSSVSSWHRNCCREWPGANRAR